MPSILSLSEISFHTPVVREPAPVTLVLFPRKASMKRLSDPFDPNPRVWAGGHECIVPSMGGSDDGTITSLYLRLLTELLSKRVIHVQ